VVILPSGPTTRVSAIQGSAGPTDAASAPSVVTVEFESDVDASRGDVITHVRNQPHVGHRVDAMVVWLGHTPLVPAGRYLIKHLTMTTGAALVGVDYRLNVDDLRREAAEQLVLNEFGRCQFETDRPLLWDTYERNRATGAFIVIDRLSCDTVGAGMIIDRLPEPAAGAVASGGSERPVTIWLTGLSGAGKSTIATVVERRLREVGRPCITLDGDRLRKGLNSDLGFSADDRRENVRRIAEVARLFTDAGLVVLVPVISPFAADRQRARDIIGADRFAEVWVDAPLSVCETRDVKGLYKKARAGEVLEFTGISSPYEPPASPDLVVESSVLTVEAAAALVLALLNPEP
jgi:bifunctional enzyme CysN/CysC